MQETTKIPTNVLDKMRCFQCQCYLSVSPIGTGANGQSICGRCIDWSLSRSEIITRCTFAEELAALHTFPCSYDSRGCKTFVRFNAALKHESICPYRPYSCPASLHLGCTWDGTLAHIYQHYQSAHPELCLKTPYLRICLTESYEMYWLIKIEKAVLLMQMKCEAKKRLWFNAVYIGHEGEETLIEYKIKLSGNVNDRNMELERKNPMPISSMHMLPSESVEVNIRHLSAILQHPEVVECWWNFTLADSLKFCTNSHLKCGGCGLSMVPPIYQCPRSHRICADCKNYNDNCNICRKSNLPFTRAVHLEALAMGATYSCRWHCGMNTSWNKIRDHELTCLRRIYKCPICYQSIGVFEEISEHFIEHPGVPLEVIHSNTVNFALKTTYSYLLVHREFFKVDVLKDMSNLWTVQIVYYGPPGFCSYYQYEIRDRYNILYYASKCGRNIYTASRVSILQDSARAECHLSVCFTKQMYETWIPL